MQQSKAADFAFSRSPLSHVAPCILNYSSKSISITLYWSTLFMTQKWSPWPLFYFTHTGIITVVYICIQGLAGTTLLYPKLLAGKIKLADQKIYHATSGLFLYTLGLGTLVLALFSNWYTTNAHPVMWWVSLSCLAWLSLVVMNQVTSEYVPKTFKKKPSQHFWLVKEYQDESEGELSSFWMVLWYFKHVF